MIRIVLVAFALVKSQGFCHEEYGEKVCSSLYYARIRALYILTDQFSRAFLHSCFDYASRAFVLQPPAREIGRAFSHTVDDRSPQHFDNARTVVFGLFGELGAQRSDLYLPFMLRWYKGELFFQPVHGKTEAQLMHRHVSFFSLSFWFLNGGFIP